MCTGFVLPHSPKGDSTESVGLLPAFGLIQAQSPMAAAIHSMAGLSVTYCPSRLARYLADSSHGAQSMCGRWPVCFAVGADASPLAVAPPQSPLWLTGKDESPHRVSPIRAGKH